MGQAAGVTGRLAAGESQVRTAAATDTCSGLDALLLQSLLAGASGRDALAPAGRPEGEPDPGRRTLVQGLRGRQSRAHAVAGCNCLGIV